ncbi:MAG: type II toxin-antitoxin system VapC family toxin [Candidatus Njordarchaeales archaeon]
MEEKLYDTSVLIDLWSSNIRRLEAYTTIFNIIEFPKALLIKNLVVLYPTREDFDAAILIAKDLLKIGKPVGAIDIVIASIALRKNLAIVTSDSDFKYIKKVRPDLKIELKQL